MSGNVPDFSDARIAALRASYAPSAFDLATLTDDRYLLASDKDHRVYYAPLGLWPSPDDRIIFVGLTPGFSQMALAARVFCETPEGERSEQGTFAQNLRSRVAFAGSMRTNLCQMLDDINFPEAFGVNQGSELFDVDQTDVATTSALVYPVFKGPELKNFSGSHDLGSFNLFQSMLDELLAPRLQCAAHALVVPFGKSAATGVAYLCKSNKVDPNRVLWGMPHPSGANGHRAQQFAENAGAMRSVVRRFFMAPRRLTA